MNWKRKLLHTFNLYGVTAITEPNAACLSSIERALRGGVDIIQLRSKTLVDAELIAFGRAVKKMVHAYKKLFIVNDRPDVCAVLDADGVHLGQSDMTVADARKIVGRNCFIGKSTHTFAQVKRTLLDDVDYIGFGPIFGTPTKPEYVPIGLSAINRVVRYAPIPVVCIGGISLETVHLVLAAGGRRIAVVRALFDTPDITGAAQQFKRILDTTTGVLKKEATR